LPRPDLWLPYVFTSPEKAAEAGVASLRWAISCFCWASVSAA